MKNILKKLFILLISGTVLFSCESMLSPDSERVVFIDEYDLSATNDTLFSLFGVFTQLQNIADSYVLLGELRGDLMEVQSTSNRFLKEIYDFNVSPENPYASNVKDYYSIVNNCNYVIEKATTLKEDDGVKLIAACKTIRAWTYMQIALNYGSAVYYTEPILSVTQAEEVQKRTPLKFNELADILISELTPIKDVEEPILNMQIHSTNFQYLLFPVQFVLGDLYLWTGQYEKAAQEYHDLIFKRSYTIPRGGNVTLRDVINNVAFTGNYTTVGGGWHNLFTTVPNEYITNIASTNEYGYKFHMDSISYNGEITASKIAIRNWNKQVYVHSLNLDTLGDTRRIGSAANRLPASNNVNQNFYFSEYDSLATQYIAKFTLMNPGSNSVRNTSKKIMVYRVGLLYLRYAEAINRMGKPNMAYAVMKNGLNPVNMSNRDIIPFSEVDSVNVPSYLDFSDIRFENNIGTKMRGSGNVNVDTLHYIIPELPTKQDSILYVEDKIQEELALETAFEGNRFHDLMRFAIRRNDNAYLADKVASKYTTNQDAIRTKLMDQANWYIKK